MKKLIALTVAAACLTAPAIAGTSDANETTNPPKVEQRTTAIPQADQRPGSDADKRDDTKKGLGRNPEDCNKGCVGGNPP